MRTSGRRAVSLLDIALPTPSLGCIEPQSTWQELHTLLTRPLRWAIKVDCQDTAWPSLLSHAKWQRNWLPTRSHSRQFHVLSSTAWAGTAKTPSKAHGFYTMSWTELQYRWETLGRRAVSLLWHCFTDTESWLYWTPVPLARVANFTHYTTVMSYKSWLSGHSLTQLALSC